MTSLSNQEYAFSLAGLFLLITFVAVGLILTRQVGPAIPLLLIAAPLPVFSYLLLVRTWMSHIHADYQRSSRMTNCLFVVGMLVALLISITMTGIAWAFRMADLSTFIP